MFKHNRICWECKARELGYPDPKSMFDDLLKTNNQAMLCGKFNLTHSTLSGILDYYKIVRNKKRGGFRTHTKYFSDPHD